MTAENREIHLVRLGKFFIPSDYADFFKTFNISGLNDYFWFLVPDDVYPECVKEKKEMYYILKKEERKDRKIFPSPIFPRYPFEFYPQKDGILPWAYGDNGTNFFWRTYKKKPWSIIVYDEMSAFFEYEMSTTKFLYKLITGEIENSGLPENLFSDKIKPIK